MHFPSDLHFRLKKQSSLGLSQAQPEGWGAFQRPWISGRENLLHLWTPAHTSVA